MSRVIVEDGDTLIVFAKTEITAQDPANEYPAVANAYRVVADRTTPTLELVPIGKPSKITHDQFATIEFMKTVDSTFKKVA